MGRKVDVNELVGTAEIAEKLGLAHPETVHNWRIRYADFPQPIARLSHTLVWAWSDVQSWARNTGRL
jgi:transposase-like protein